GELNLVHLVCLVEVNDHHSVRGSIDIEIGVFQFGIAKPLKETVPRCTHYGDGEFAFELFADLDVVPSSVEVDVVVFVENSATAFGFFILRFFTREAGEETFNLRWSVFGCCAIHFSIEKINDDSCAFCCGLQLRTCMHCSSENNAEKDNFHVRVFALVPANFLPYSAFGEFYQSLQPK